MRSTAPCSDFRTDGAGFQLSQRERSEAENGMAAASLRRPPSAQPPLMIGSLLLARSLLPLTSALH